MFLEFGGSSFTTQTVQPLKEQASDLSQWHDLGVDSLRPQQVLTCGERVVSTQVTKVASPKPNPTGAAHRGSSWCRPVISLEISIFQLTIHLFHFKQLCRKTSILKRTVPLSIIYIGFKSRWHTPLITCLLDAGPHKPPFGDCAVYSPSTLVPTSCFRPPAKPPHLSNHRTCARSVARSCSLAHSTDLQPVRMRGKPCKICIRKMVHCQ